jgi:hypothetical protein
MWKMSADIGQPVGAIQHTPDRDSREISREPINDGWYSSMDASAVPMAWIVPGDDDRMKTTCRMCLSAFGSASILLKRKANHGRTCRRAGP